MKNLFNNIKLIKKLEKESIDKFNLKKIPKYKLFIDLNTRRSLGFFKKDKNGNLSIHLHKELIYLKKYKEVIIHEFSHMLAYHIYGYNISPHGKEWKYIMKELGSKSISATTSDFTKEIIKLYPEQFKELKCNCGKIKIPLRKANTLLKKKSICRSCNKKIKAA